MPSVKYWDGTAWVPIASVTGPQGPSGPQGPPGNIVVTGTYAVTSGYTKDRTFNPAGTTVNEMAAVLATLIDDMKGAGMLQ